MNLNIDLNLLKTFDVVMTTGHVHKASYILGISPSAVSQSLRKLKSLYNDELFIKDGRGIKPTNFALKLHSKIHSPLNLILGGLMDDELYEPETSSRIFKLSSHIDVELMYSFPVVHYFNEHSKRASFTNTPHGTSVSDGFEQLKIQKLDLVISTEPNVHLGFKNKKLMEFDLVVVAKKNHPRIREKLTKKIFLSETHIIQNHFRFNELILESLTNDKLADRKVGYLSDSLCHSILLSAQSEWLTVVPNWYADIMAGVPFDVYALPFKCGKVPLYMTWHETQDEDLGHKWLRDSFTTVFKGLLSQYVPE